MEYVTLELSSIYLSCVGGYFLCFILFAFQALTKLSRGLGYQGFALMSEWDASISTQVLFYQAPPVARGQQRAPAYH